MIDGFRANINADNVNIQTKVHIVSNSAIQYDMILGQPLLQDSTIIIDRNNLKFMTMNIINKTTHKKEKNGHLRMSEDNRRG